MLAAVSFLFSPPLRRSAAGFFQAAGHDACTSAPQSHKAPLAQQAAQADIPNFAIRMSALNAKFFVVEPPAIVTTWSVCWLFHSRFLVSSVIIPSFRSRRVRQLMSAWALPALTRCPLRPLEPGTLFPGGLVNPSSEVLFFLFPSPHLFGSVANGPLRRPGSAEKTPRFERLSKTSNIFCFCSRLNEPLCQQAVGREVLEIGSPWGLSDISGSGVRGFPSLFITKSFPWSIPATRFFCVRGGWVRSPSKTRFPL